MSPAHIDEHLSHALIVFLMVSESSQTIIDDMTPIYAQAQPGRTCCHVRGWTYALTIWLSINDKKSLFVVFYLV